MDRYLAIASYAGAPKDNTAMYISKKVEHLLENLYQVSGCTVFVETGMTIPEELSVKHRFIITDNVQGAYADYLKDIEKRIQEQDRQRGYELTQGGYYIGKNTIIGNNTYIEPGCFIGHDVTIGENTIIKAGAVIKNCQIGNNCLINEMALIGANGFNMARDKENKLIRIPSLGKVMIGDNAEIGAQDNISRGSAGNTFIADNVKLDALVYIAHDVYIEKNVEIAGGTSVGGFCHIGEDTFIGFNTSIKNRIKIGKNVTVGMGSVVLKEVESNSIVYGHPAREKH